MVTFSLKNKLIESWPCIKNQINKIVGMEYFYFVDKIIERKNYQPPDGAYQKEVLSIPFLWYKPTCLPTPSCCGTVTQTIRRKFLYIKCLEIINIFDRQICWISTWKWENYKKACLMNLKRNKRKEKHYRSCSDLHLTLWWVKRTNRGELAWWNHIRSS